MMCSHDVLFTVIPYHFTVITGDERDAGTTSRAYVIIHGREGVTDRMWLDMPEESSGFVPEALDTFHCHGSDVGDIKRVEARDSHMLRHNITQQRKHN